MAGGRSSGREGGRRRECKLKRKTSHNDVGNISQYKARQDDIRTDKIQEEEQTR